RHPRARLADLDGADPLVPAVNATHRASPFSRAVGASPDYSIATSGLHRGPGPARPRLPAINSHMAVSIAERPLVARFAAVVAALRNLVERLQYGSVTDFIQVPPLPLFQVFNLADASICVGAALLLLLSYRQPSSQDPDT